MADDRKFCTFMLDGMLFGIEVLKVQEVIRLQEMTRAPRAPSVVCGLINLRGQIVTAIDLRRRLQLRERPADQSSMHVVIRTGDETVSLLVDEIGDVQKVDEEAFERPPETVTDTARDLIRGAYKLKDRLLLVLDTEKTVQVAMS